MGKPEMACRYFKEAYTIKKVIYGSEHKNTLHTSVLLAQTLFVAKDYDQRYFYNPNNPSVIVFKELIAGQEKAYGQNSL